MFVYWKVFTLFILLTVIACPCSAASPLVLSTYAGEPLSTPEQSGYYDLIMAEAFKRLDREIEIVRLPAERSLINADLGYVDGEFVRIAGLTKIYPNLVQVPEKIIDFEFMAFSKKPGIITSDWRFLQPYHVGIVRGWKILEKYIVNTASLTRAKDQIILFNMLEKDRLDVVVYSRFEGSYLLRQLGMQDVSILEPPLATEEMFLYLNKKHAELVPALATALANMKSEGLFEKFMTETLSLTKP